MFPDQVLATSGPQATIIRQTEDEPIKINIFVYCFAKAR